MERSRRGVLASVAGVFALAGCGSPESAWPVDEQPTIEADLKERAKQQLTESSGRNVSATDLVAEYDADVYVFAEDDQFLAVDETETELAATDDLGRTINEAQATLADGRIVVAADGLLRVAVEPANRISIRGVDPRAGFTPAETVDGSSVLYRLSDGTAETDLTSVTLDMQYRGGSAIRADGATGLAFDDLRVRNVGAHGTVFAGGRAIDIRNTQFEGVSKNAVQVTDCSDVRIASCESTGSDRAVYVTDSSNVTISDYTTRNADYNAIGLYDYTENWEITGCTAVDSGSTPFSASTARNGSFIDCVAEGTKTSGEAGFEIEYKADSDEENTQDPIVGCSVESCTARDCSVGFYAREDDSKYDTGTPIVRPRFVDCTAESCDTGLFIGDTVEEAIVENFEAVDCNTDVVDNGKRTIVDGRSTNEGDPSTQGEWFGFAEAAAELDVVVEDTQEGTGYTATERGVWQER